MPRRRCSRARGRALLALAALAGCGESRAPVLDAHVRDSSAPNARDAGDVVDASDGRDAATDASSEDAGPAPGPIVGADYVDFGALSVPESGVVRVVLELPEDARAFVLTADPGALPRRLSLLSLQGPDGLWFELADTDEPSQPGSPPRYVPAAPANLATGVPYAFAVPSSPERALLPGRYLIELHVAAVAGEPDAKPVPLGVDAVLQTRAPASPGRLGLALWSASEALDAATLARDPQLAGMLAAAERIFTAAGITLDLPSGLRALASPADGLGTLDDDAELGALLMRLQHAAGPEIVAHAILVDTIASGPGKTVLAKTTGVPGTPAHAELARRSAVVLARDELPEDPERAGAVLAHELGHLLGLRHTSDADGGGYDAIADTPECPAERASRVLDGIEPLLSAEDCAELDGSNLMFYTPSKSDMAQETLTEGQRYVLTHSPLLR